MNKCAVQINFTQPQLKPQNPGPDGRYGCTSLIMKMYRNELSREIAKIQFTENSMACMQLREEWEYVEI
jgi:hypothetical protein